MNARPGEQSQIRTGTNPESAEKNVSTIQSYVHLLRLYVQLEKRNHIIADVSPLREGPRDRPRRKYWKKKEWAEGREERTSVRYLCCIHWRKEEGRLKVAANLVLLPFLKRIFPSPSSNTILWSAPLSLAFSIFDEEKDFCFPEGCHRSNNASVGRQISCRNLAFFDQSLAVQRTPPTHFWPCVHAKCQNIKSGLLFFQGNVCPWNLHFERGRKLDRKKGTRGRTFERDNAYFLTVVTRHFFSQKFRYHLWLFLSLFYIQPQI